MFPIPARARAGALTAAAAAAALLGAATPAAASVLPTFERTDYPTPHRATTMSIGDVSGDGRPDAVSNSLLGSALAVYPGTGGGVLGPVNAFAIEPAADFTSGVDLGDVDGDGDLDATVIRESHLILMRNDGQGIFSVAQTIATHRSLVDVTLADVDRDGDKDALGVYGYTLGDDADGGWILWLGGQGASPLVERSRGSFIGVATSSMLEDVDGDGHRDLVYAARLRVGAAWTFDAPDGLAIQKGDGTGGFGERRFLDAGSMQTTNYVRHFDITGDGVKDLVAGHGNSSTISWWRGLGGGEFADAVTPLNSSYQGNSALGDFDGNGQTDVAFPQGPNYGVEVFTNWTDGRPWGYVRLDVPRRYVYAIAAGDLDGDGRTDLVVASHDDYDPTRTITVFRNTTAQPAACADGHDNDGDGKFDLDDPGCSSSTDDDEADPPPPPPPAAQCDDGSDNDGDGNIDAADAGCSSTTDDDESDDPAPPPPVELLPWTGFFAPVNNPPTVNLTTAGRAVPVKFSLGGDRGLDVFAAGYPRSQQVECSATADVDGVEETVAAGASGLTYDAGADRYQYVWKTSDAWAATCRQLVLKLRDGSLHRASFRFR